MAEVPHRGVPEGLIDYDRVADVYDLYVTPDFDVRFLVEEAAGARGPVLELMSGTGRVSVPLVEAGVDLTCVDVSEPMLARLREKLAARGLSARVVRSDVRYLDPAGVYDLAMVPFHSFSELVEPRDRELALAAIHGCLREGGRLILPLQNPSVRARSADGVLRLNGTFPTEGGRLVISGYETLETGSGVVDRLQFYEFFDASGELRTKRLLPMRFALLGEEEVRNLATSAGFRPVALYGDYERSGFDPRSSPFAIWVLQKGVDPGADGG